MPERGWAVRLYSETRLPVEDIAGLFGVSRQTIYNWIEEAGVPRRGPAGSMPRLPEDTASVSVSRVEAHLAAQEARAEFWSAEIARMRDDMATLRMDHANTDRSISEGMAAIEAIRADVLANREGIQTISSAWSAQLAELTSQVARLVGLIEGRKSNGGEGVRFLKGK